MLPQLDMVSVTFYIPHLPWPAVNKQLRYFNRDGAKNERQDSPAAGGPSTQRNTAFGAKPQATPLQRPNAIRLDTLNCSDASTTQDEETDHALAKRFL